MSEEICQKCGLSMEQCKCSKTDRTIVIRHEGLPKNSKNLEKSKTSQDSEIEMLKKERDDYLAIVQLQANKEFEQELDSFLAQVDDEDKKEQIKEIIGDDPDKLENAKIMTSLIEQAIIQGGGKVTGRKPSGKATLPPRNSGLNSNYKDFIDTLYATARDPSKTQQERDSANRMIDELFLEVVKGINVSRKKFGRSLPDYQMNECPRCHTLIQSPRGIPFEQCPSCGWSLYTRQAVVS